MQELWKDVPFEIVETLPCSRLAGNLPKRKCSRNKTLRRGADDQQFYLDEQVGHPLTQLGGCWKRCWTWLNAAEPDSICIKSKVADFDTDGKCGQKSTDRLPGQIYVNLNAIITNKIWLSTGFNCYNAIIFKVTYIIWTFWWIDIIATCLDQTGNNSWILPHFVQLTLHT